MTNEFNTILVDRILSKTVLGTIQVDSPVSFNDGVVVPFIDTSVLKVDTIEPLTPGGVISVTNTPRLDVNGEVQTTQLLTGDIEHPLGPIPIEVHSPLFMDPGESFATDVIVARTGPDVVFNLCNCVVAGGNSVKTDSILSTTTGNIQLSATTVTCEIGTEFRTNTIRSSTTGIVEFTQSATIDPGSLLRCDDIRSNSGPVSIGAVGDGAVISGDLTVTGILMTDRIQTDTSGIITVENDCRFTDASGISTLQIQNLNNAIPINVLASLVLDATRFVTADTVNANTLSPRTGTVVTSSQDLQYGTNDLLFGVGNTSAMSELSGLINFLQGGFNYKPFLVPRLGAAVENNMIPRTLTSALTYYAAAADAGTITTVQSGFFSIATGANDTWNVTYTGPLRYVSFRIIMSVVQNIAVGLPGIRVGIFVNPTVSGADAEITAGTPTTTSSQVATWPVGDVDQVLNLATTFNGVINTNDVLYLGLQHNVAGANVTISYMSIDADTQFAGSD